MSQQVPAEPTGFYDAAGIPIYVGDLIRVKHFKHYQRRRQIWLYFRVAKLGGKYVLQNWYNLDPTRHQCLLGDWGTEDREVLADQCDERDVDGVPVMFCERQRRKGGE